MPIDPLPSPRLPALCGLTGEVSVIIPMSVHATLNPAMLKQASYCGNVSAVGVIPLASAHMVMPVGDLDTQQAPSFRAPLRVWVYRVVVLS